MASSVAKAVGSIIAAGEIPRQDVELSAAAIVGALAEALVGPLSPISGEKPPDELTGVLRVAQIADRHDERVALSLVPQCDELQRR